MKPKAKLRLVTSSSEREPLSTKGANAAVVQLLQSVGGLVPADAQLLAGILGSGIQEQEVAQAVRELESQGALATVWMGHRPHLALRTALDPTGAPTAGAASTAQTGDGLASGNTAPQETAQPGSAALLHADSASAATPSDATPSAHSLSAAEEEAFSLQVAVDVETERALLFRFLLILLLIVGTVAARQVALTLLGL